MGNAPMRRYSMRKAQERMLKVEADIERYRKLKIAAYEDMKDGLLTKEDYQDITAQYEARISKELLAKEQIHREMDLYLQNEASPQQWIQEFLAYRNVQALTRIVAAQCIERIVIYEGKRIELTFRHMQDYQALVSQVQDYHQQIQEGAG